MSPGTRVQLTEVGMQHYPRTANERAQKTGVIICQLPSGAIGVSWPWGIAFNTRAELTRASDGT
jgi:hypothetical protein